MVIKDEDSDKWLSEIRIKIDKDLLLYYFSLEQPSSQDLLYFR